MELKPIQDLHIKWLTLEESIMQQINKSIGVLCQEVGGLSEVADTWVCTLNNTTSNNPVTNPTWNEKDLIKVGKVTLRVG